MWHDWYSVNRSGGIFEIYGLRVIEITTHKPMIRIDHNDQIYKTKEEKYDAVLELVKNKYEIGQPVLIELHL